MAILFISYTLSYIIVYFLFKKNKILWILILAAFFCFAILNGLIYLSDEYSLDSNLIDGSVLFLLPWPYIAGFCAFLYLIAIKIEERIP